GHSRLRTRAANAQSRGSPEPGIVGGPRVPSREMCEPPRASVGYPADWWDFHGDITLASVMPLLVHALPKPAQAVTFTWRGAATRIAFAAGEKQVAHRYVTDAEEVYVEAARIETIIILDTHGTLESLRTLDLFAERDL